ncbi:MAG TPA: cytochrome b [Sphingorhabdus sp.]|nr:cytochrome b [Sphingorhabdus sp.]
MISKYSKGAIALHWLIAALVIANFVLASMAEDLPREAQGAFMAPHKAIGVSILLFSLVRLFWRFTHKPPALPEAIPGWQASLGKIVHVLFYFLIIAVPFSGWLMASAHPQAPPVDFFGLFDATMPIEKSKDLAGIGHEAHEILTKPLFILILLHILAALKHQFADRIPFIQRMWP